MKKKIITIVVVLLVMIGIGFIIYKQDNLRFKIGYEMYNSRLFDSKKNIVNVKIPFDNRMNYLNTKELDEFLKNGTGILYFGYSTCPWCRNVVPILIDAARDSSIYTINYVDIHKVDIDKINLVEKLKDYLSEDENGNKRFAVPDVYVIKNGEILDNHLGTVDSYHNPYKGMTDGEKNELKEIYMEMFREIR